jgi:hypothetical protein
MSIALTLAQQTGRRPRAASAFRKIATVGAFPVIPDVFLTDGRSALLLPVARFG